MRNISKVHEIIFWNLLRSYGDLKKLTCQLLIYYSSMVWLFSARIWVIEYATLRDKWSIDELITVYVHEENRLSTKRVEQAHLTTTMPGKKSINSKKFSFLERTIRVTVRIAGMSKIKVRGNKALAFFVRRKESQSWLLQIKAMMDNRNNQEGIRKEADVESRTGWPRDLKQGKNRSRIIWTFF